MAYRRETNKERVERLTRVALKAEKEGKNSQQAVREQVTKETAARQANPQKGGTFVNEEGATVLVTYSEDNKGFKAQTVDYTPEAQAQRTQQQQAVEKVNRGEELQPRDIVPRGGMQLTQRNIESTQTLAGQSEQNRVVRQAQEQERQRRKEYDTQREEYATQAEKDAIRNQAISQGLEWLRLTEFVSGAIQEKQRQDLIQERNKQFAAPFMRAVGGKFEDEPGAYPLISRAQSSGVVLVGLVKTPLVDTPIGVSQFFSGLGEGVPISQLVQEPYVQTAGLTIATVPLLFTPVGKAIVGVAGTSAGVYQGLTATTPEEKLNAVLMTALSVPLLKELPLKVRTTKIPYQVEELQFKKLRGKNGIVLLQETGTKLVSRNRKTYTFGLEFGTKSIPFAIVDAQKGFIKDYVPVYEKVAIKPQKSGSAKVDNSVYLEKVQSKYSSKEIEMFKDMKEFLPEEFAKVAGKDVIKAFETPKAVPRGKTTYVDLLTTYKPRYTKRVSPSRLTPEQFAFPESSLGSRTYLDLLDVSKGTKTRVTELIRAADAAKDVKGRVVTSQEELQTLFKDVEIKDFGKAYPLFKAFQETLPSSAQYKGSLTTVSQLPEGFGNKVIGDIDIALKGTAESNAKYLQRAVDYYNTETFKSRNTNLASSEFKFSKELIKVSEEAPDTIIDVKTGTKIAEFSFKGEPGFMGREVSPPRLAGITLERAKVKLGRQTASSAGEQFINKVSASLITTKGTASAELSSFSYKPGIFGKITESNKRGTKDIAGAFQSGFGIVRLARESKNTRVRATGETVDRSLKKAFRTFSKEQRAELLLKIEETTKSKAVEFEYAPSRRKLELRQLKEVAKQPKLVEPTKTTKLNTIVEKSPEPQFRDFSPVLVSRSNIPRSVRTNSPVSPKLASPRSVFPSSPSPRSPSPLSPSPRSPSPRSPSPLSPSPRSPSPRSPSPLSPSPRSPSPRSPSPLSPSPRFKFSRIPKRVGTPLKLFKPSKQTRMYTPTLTALTFNIKQPQASSQKTFSGLEIRGL